MLTYWIEQAGFFLWSVPLPIFLLGTGLYLTLRLDGLTLRHLPLAFSLINRSREHGAGQISGYQALCTMLAATLGMGNLVGVATALQLGGPGALFWMSLAALLGMALQYAEGLLAVKYRETDTEGRVVGGPMSYITHGLGSRWRPLALIFSFCGLLTALFGMPTLPQAQVIAGNLYQVFDIPLHYTAVGLMLIVGICLFGGLKRTAELTALLVPLMAVLYVALCLGVIARHSMHLPTALTAIKDGIFSSRALSGGAYGAFIPAALRVGLARGMFTNEAGLGSAPLAAASAQMRWPAEQGLISMTSAFFDTLVICNLTGLALLCSGVWNLPVAAEILTQQAFAQNFPAFGAQLFVLCLVLFAVTSILGWSYYGERCATWMWGSQAAVPYRLIYIAMIGLGVFLQPTLLWQIADVANALMALPNLIALLALSGVTVHETRRYFAWRDRRRRR